MYENLTHKEMVEIIESYQKRIEIIKDDVKAIYYCINQDESLGSKLALTYGGYVPDVCLMNINIACDLHSNECFEWEFYSNL
jgi:hypothetical protein